MSVQFELTDDDRFAIRVATEFARRLVQKPRISPKQIVGLGHAICALERLPRETPGVHCEFGIVYRFGTEDFSELKYITFFIEFDRFEISIGGSVYERSVGATVSPHQVGSLSARVTVKPNAICTDSKKKSKSISILGQGSLSRTNQKSTSMNLLKRTRKSDIDVHSQIPC